MKKSLLLIVLGTIFSIGNMFAQPWMKAPYLPQNKTLNQQQGQGLKLEEIQTAFNAYWQGKTVTKGHGYKQYKRWANFHESRLMPDGSFPSAKYVEEIYLNSAASKGSASNTNTSLSLPSPNWNQIELSDNVVAGYGNNYNGTGQVTCIAIDPNDTNKIIIGSPSGGMWTTSDGGLNWNILKDDYPYLGYTSIVYHPTNSNIIYATTGDDRYDGALFGYTIGLIKSIDGGATWSSSLTPFYATYQNQYCISQVIINPENPNSIMIVGSLGIHKSTDGGITWTASIGGMNSVRNIEYKPGDTTVVYASTRNSIYKSTDGGSSFSLVNGGFPASSGVGAISLGVSAADPSVVYALVSNQNYDFKALYKSTDSGNNWSLKYNSLNILCGEPSGSGTYNQGWWCLSLTVSQENANELYTGGINIWKSADGGSSFSLLSSYYPYGGVVYTHADQQVLYKQPGSNTLYVGNDGGFHKIYPNNPSISTLNHGLNNALLYKMADSELDKSKLYGGLQDNGCYLLNNGTWTNVLTSDATDGYYDLSDPFKIYLSGSGGILYRTDNGGTTKTNISPGASHWVTPFAVNPTNSDMIVYATTSDIYRSTDRGSNWSQLTSNLGGGYEIKNITIDNTGNTIYASTVNSSNGQLIKLYRTTNGGGQWDDITGALGNTALTGIYANPSNPQNIWITRGGFVDGTKILYSSDGGNNWTNVSGTLPNIPFNCVIQDEKTKNIFIGSDMGVYYSDSSMTTWTSYNTGLPNVIVSDMEINYLSGKLQISTWGRGIWETEIPTQQTTPFAAPCERLNYPLSNTFAGFAPGWGYVSGQNGAGWNEFAQYFSSNGVYTHVSGAAFDLASLKSNDLSAAKITVRLYKNDGAGGKPGTVIVEKDVTYDELIAEYQNGGTVTMMFDNPIAMSTPYYLGYELYYNATNKDTIAFKYNAYSLPTVNNGYIKSGGNWLSYTDIYAGTGSNFAMYPIVGSKPTVAFTGSDVGGCMGATIDYTNNSTGGNAFKWTFSGGNPSYSYANEPSVVYTSNGTFDVKLVVFGSCNLNDSLTKSNYITIGSPSITGSITDVTCKNELNGAIDITVTGTGPFTYSWSNGATSEDLSNVSAGTYTVIATGTGPCAVDTATFVVSEPTSVLDVSGLVVDVSCYNSSNGSIDITASGGTAPYTYTWSGNIYTEDRNSLSDGSYSITVKDNNGCTVLKSFSVNEPTQILISVLSQNNPTCGNSNGSIDIDVSGGTSGYSYSWSSMQTIQDISALSSGTYIVTVTDANNCTKSKAIILSLPNALNATAVVSSVSCNGLSDGAINVTTSGGTSPYTFSWTNNGTTEDLSGINAGNYNVIITDSVGCTYTLNNVVTEPDELTLTLSATNLNCFSDQSGSINSIVSGGTSPYTYSWTNSATTQNISSLAANSYTLTVTDSKLCTISKTETVTEPNELTAIVTSHTVPTCGNSNGAIDVTVAGGTPGYTYSWSSSETTEDLNGLNQGIFTLTVTDTKLCSVSITDSLLFSNSLFASAVVSNVKCNQGSDGNIDVTVFGGSTPYTYLWASLQTTEDLTGIAAGTYTLTVTDFTGCTFVIEKTISEPSILQATITKKNACFNSCDGKLTTMVSGGTLPYTYSWDDSNSQTTVIASGLCSGNYTVQITDSNNCVTSASNSIGNQTEIQISLNQKVNALCNQSNDGALDVNVIGGTLPYTYSWSNNSTTEDISALNAGAYSVTVTDSIGCSVVFNDTISEPLAISLSGTVTNVSVNGGGDGSVAINSVDGGTPGYTYSWSNSETTEDISNLTANTYTITVTDANGCLANETFTVTEPALPQNGCNGLTLLNANSGVFDDNSGVNDYAINSNCKWLIQPAGATSITLGFDAFDTESGYDFVNIYDGIDSTATLIGEFSGSNLPSNVISTGGALFVQFISDYDINAAGWSAWYNASFDTDTCDMTITATGTNTTCDGCSDGSATVSVTGGTAPIYYWWTNGETTQSINGLTADTYWVYVWDSGICYDSAEVVITDPTVTCTMSLSAIGTDATCIGCSDASIDLTVTGSTGTINYAWDNAEVTEDLNGVFAGCYQVTVTDGAGCIDTLTTCVGEPASPTYCSGNVVLTAPSGTFNDGSGATDYQDFANCSWLIQPAGALSITLTFNDFATENGYDSVYVYDGANSGAALLGGYTGNTIPPVLTSTGGSMFVWFKSDNLYVDAGWSASYTSLFPYCSGTTTLTAASGSFDDGSGLNDYTNYSDCKWLIQPTGATSITLTFNSFDTETGYDSVYVYDGANSSATLLGGFTGNTLPPVLTSTGGSMFVWFKSDYLYTMTGWDASYTSTAPFCAGTTTLTASIGSFSDGSGTSDYNNFTDCKWLIQPSPAASSISLTFTSFDVEAGYDSVMVYDGANTTDPLLGTFTGNTLPPMLTSSGGSMLVWFLSDNIITASGWSADYSSTVSIASSKANSEKVSIVPNPTSGQFTVSFAANGKTKVELVNVIGAKLYSEETEEKGMYQRDLNISDYSTGVYFLKVTTNKGEQIVKVVKQ